MQQQQELVQAMADLEEEAVNSIVDKIISSGGEDAYDALIALQEGMSRIGDLFEEGIYYVSDLIYAGELMSEVAEKLKPALITVYDDMPRTKMILCTVYSDLHDIGKNIVKVILEAANFDVIDLGVDVQPEAIVEAAKEHDATIVGLSGVLMLSLDSMKDTVDAFVASGTRSEVKIIIGGNPVSEEAKATIGADAWAQSPQKGLDICRAWAEA